MSGKKKKKVVEILTNENLPTLLVDNLAITTRTDGLHFIRFTTALPEGLKEQVRMMVPDERMKRMLDALCSHCDHYPAKPKSRKKSSRRKGE